MKYKGYFLFRSGRSLTLIILFFLFLNPFYSHSASDQSFNPNMESLHYYYQLKSEEFMEMMIPKERFLLGLIQNINKEIKIRRNEGLKDVDLDLNELSSPVDLIIDEYVQEIERIVRLMDEIDDLERKAKQKVDFEVLESLTKLKIYVSKLIEEEIGTQDQTVSALNTTSEIEQDKREEFSNHVQDEKESSDLAREMDLDDLFNQWKSNRILDYKVKLTRYRLLRVRLLKSADSVQVMRMFKRDYKEALLSYSNGNLPLSRIQFQDILETYRFLKLDDVLFYSSECGYGLNFLDEALKGYYRLIQRYPQSLFYPKALAKIIYIHYLYDELEDIFNMYSKLYQVKKELDPDIWGMVSYLAGYAHFKSGSYQKALQILGAINSQSTYYYPALYLSATCYTNLGDFQGAISLYRRFIQEKNEKQKDPILAQIKNNALLKLGLIYYEQGDHEKATTFFQHVSEDFKFYDLSMIGRAWSAYRSGRPIETLKSVEWLLKNDLISNYAYEARVLAASSKELLGLREEALKDLKQVFHANNQTFLAGDYNAESNDIIESDHQIENQLDERDYALFVEAERIQRLLRNVVLKRRNMMDENSQRKKERRYLTRQIEILDRLEEQALEGEQSHSLREIRKVRSQMILTLEDQSGTILNNLAGSIEDPLIQHMGIREYIKYLFQALLMETLREKEKTRKDTEKAQQYIQQAFNQDQFDVGIQMEIKQEELEDYYRKLNQYEIYLREHFPKEFRVELDQWANFSGYGISNINFSRIKQIEERMVELSTTIEKLDIIFQQKENDLERRVQDLLNDVDRIEKQLQRELTKREQREKETFFKTKYYNRERQEPMGGKLYPSTETESEEK